MELINNITNKSTSLTHREEIFSKSFTVFYITISLLIIVIGIITNVMIIYLYYKNCIARTLFNFYLMHLGISNIIQNIGAIPYLFVDHAGTSGLIQNLSETGESATCAIFDGQSIFFTGAFVTVYTISYMTYKWYRVTQSPLRVENSKKSIFYTVLVIWIVGCLLVAPNFFSFKMNPCLLYTSPSPRDS